MELRGAADKEFHSQEGLAAAGAAADESGAPAGRPPKVIWSKPWMPVGHFGNRIL
jgi:hypothetical protein